MRIGFAGMTHLGINSLAATAERGFSVIGFDSNQTIINQLNINHLPIIEPQLPELINKNRAKLEFTSEKKELLKCDIVYISMDVPTNDTGQSNLRDIKILIEEVSKNLNSNAILVILCQVPPGFTRTVNFPLDRLFYQVETLIFGQAIERALYPERFIIGCANSEQSLPLNYFRLLEKFECAVLQMCYESAELVKISINCCLVSSINVANTLGEICENIGANWSEIVPALKLDKRIGQFAYLSPGLGIAGGNLERDLNTVLELSSHYGTDDGIISAWIKNSQYRRDWVLRVLHKELLSKKINPTVAVLGLAYKENTNSIKNSPAIALLENLKFSCRIKAYDPVVLPEMLSKNINIYFVNSIEEAIKDADALVIMTPWAEFKNLVIKTLMDQMKGRLIIDPYKVINSRDNMGFKYLTLGTKVTC